MPHVVLRALVDHYVDYDAKHVSMTYGHWKVGIWNWHPRAIICGCAIIYGCAMEYSCYICRVDETEEDN